MTCGPHGTVDIIHNGSDEVGFWLDPWKRSIYQTFVTPPWCRTITGIRVKLKKNWGPSTPAVVAEIYEASNNQPTGCMLARSSFPGPPGKDFAIVGGRLIASVNPSTKYAVVLSVDANAPQGTSCEWAVAPVYDDLGFGQWSAATSTWVDKSAVGNGWLQIDVIDAENTIDVTHAGTSGATFGQANDQMIRYQTFLAKGDQPVVGVDLKLRRSPTGVHSDVIAQLHAVPPDRSLGFPLLATAVIPASAIGMDWTVVNAPLYFCGLSLGQEYAVMLTQRQLQQDGGTYEWATGHANRAISFGKCDPTGWKDETQFFGNGWMRVRVMPPLLTNYEISPEPERPRGFGFGTGADEIKRFQTFCLAESAVVIGADVMIVKTGPDDRAAHSDVQAELYRASGGFPTGGALSRATLPSCYVNQYELTTVHFPLKSQTLPAGDYALVLSQVSPGAAHYEWGVDWFAKKYRFGKWNGSSWIDETSSLGNGWIRLWTTSSDEESVICPAQVTGYGLGNAAGEIKRFQTFWAPPIADDPHGYYSLNGVQLQLRRFNGSGQSDLIVELHPASGDWPYSNPMATGVVPSSMIGTEWTFISVPLYYLGVGSAVYVGGGSDGVIATRKYAIVLSQRSPHEARYQWAAGFVPDQSFGYWNGSSWVTEKSDDCGWLKVSLIKMHRPD